MGLEIQYIDHISLHVESVSTSEDFYGRVLGLKPMKRPNFGFQGAWFSIGPQQQLHLIAGRELSVHSEKRGTHFAFRVSDIMHWKKHLEKLTQTFIGPKLRPDGQYQLFLKDPDGYTIELTAET